MKDISGAYIYMCNDGGGGTEPHGLSTPLSPQIIK